MMLALAEYCPPKSLIDALVSLGYEDFGEAGGAQRRYLRRHANSDFNLHPDQLHVRDQKTVAAAVPAANDAAFATAD